MAHLVDMASAAAIGTVSSTSLLTLGTVVRDEKGSEYMYVGASGVAAGAPVKVVTSLALCVTGTGETHAIGVASQDFPSTGFTYGFIGIRGVHPTKVPSGTAVNTRMVGGNGTTKGVTGTFSRLAITLAAAQNDGSAIDALWL